MTVDPNMYIMVAYSERHIRSTRLPSSAAWLLLCDCDASFAVEADSCGQLIKNSVKCASDWSQKDTDFKGFSRGFDDTAVGHGQSWAHAVNSLPFTRRLPRPTANNKDSNKHRKQCNVQWNPEMSGFGCMFSPMSKSWRAASRSSDRVFEHGLF